MIESQANVRPPADFVCNGPKCRTEAGEAPVYELPLDAKRCPVCGSKRIQRLFNKVGVLRGDRSPDRDPRLTSSSHLVRSNALLRPGYDHHDLYKPGYTPPEGGELDSRMRYDKLETFTVPVGQVTNPGKGEPMKPEEIRAEIRRDKRSAVAQIARVALGNMPPTNKMVSKDDAA